MTPLIYLQITIGFMIETFVLGFLYVKVGERERERERETERERQRTDWGGEKDKLCCLLKLKYVKVYPILISVPAVRNVDVASADFT